MSGPGSEAEGSPGQASETPGRQSRSGPGCAEELAQFEIGSPVRAALHRKSPEIQTHTPDGGQTQQKQDRAGGVANQDAHDQIERNSREGLFAEEKDRPRQPTGSEFHQGADLVEREKRSEVAQRLRVLDFQTPGQPVHLEKAAAGRPRTGSEVEAQGSGLRQQSARAA